MERKMAETKEFATEDVLSAVVGVLVSERGMGSVYEVLNWMSGESLMTHQIVRVMKEARPVMFAAYPVLAEAMADSHSCNRETWEQWRDAWVDKIGPVISVVKLTEDTHERIDPISEEAEVFHPSKVITIDLRGED